MLLYKIWFETRSRFFIGVLFITFLCLFFVIGNPLILAQWARDEKLHPEWDNPTWLALAKTDFVYFIWHFLYNYLLQLVCALFTIMLSLGGLINEYEKGSSLFTLSLPVTRKQIFFLRNLIGFAETVALALLPAFVIPAASVLIGKSYDLNLAVTHSLFFIIGATAFYSFGIFVNTLLKTESLSFLIALGSV